MKRIFLTVLLSLTALVGAYLLYARNVTNPAVTEDIRNDPTSDRAARAMLITLPNGRELPVNFLHEGSQVFIGVDGRWWRDFIDPGARVSLYMKGHAYEGHAVAVLDNPAYTEEIFSRLRPTAPEWLPAWLNGKLVVINLDQD
ncbi:MAG: hypothetical protein GKR90_09635 [Pseudomonadales bacterium]|nr:hypothetical protein [Pseudomonadales bacterium]